jgi:quercetin dioxygenase-like cupin family protein
VAVAPKYGIELYPDAKPVPDTNAPAADRVYWVLGQLVTFKLTSQDTGGYLSAVEITSNPGEGVPPHRHRAMEELFYVLEGTYDFTFDERVEHVEAGDLLFVPRGTMHGFSNVGGTPARLFDVHSPGGFDAFFEEAGVRVTDPTAPPPGPPPDTDGMLALMRKHGMEMRLP